MEKGKGKRKDLPSASGPTPTPPRRPSGGDRSAPAAPHLVLLLAQGSRARRPLLEALAVMGPRLVGRTELHHRGGFLLPLLPPAAATPPGSGVEGRESGRRKRGGGAGKGSGAGSVPEQTTAPTQRRERERRSLEPGTGVEAPPLPGRHRSPWSHPHTRLALSCCRLRCRRKRGSGSRHEETVAGTGAYWAATPRQLRRPFAVFKGPRTPAPLGAPPCAPARREPLRRGRAQGGGLSLQAAGFRQGGRAGAPPQRGNRHSR